MTAREFASASQLVIVGAGLAGLRAAEGAREAGFSGAIVLIGEEARAPYDRPPLSKTVLLDGVGEAEIALAPDEALTQLSVDAKFGSRVVSIDRAARTVMLQSGESVRYDRLVLATGSRIRPMPALPPHMAGVHYLRTLDDALALRAAIASANRIAIVGGGVIGLEVAAAASVSNKSVTVIEMQSRVMARTSACVVSDYFEARHRQAGVDFRFGATITDAVASKGVLMLALSDGGALEADLAVVGIGVEPNSEIARDAGLVLERGSIIVDAFGRTSDEAIYAAGEVTLHYNAFYGRHDRQETWAHAAAHGAHVGRSIVAEADEYAEVHSYWTDQFEINLMNYGAAEGDESIVRGDPASGKFLVFHITGGKIAGVTTINSQRELRAAKKLLGCESQSALLADPATPLAALV